MNRRANLLAETDNWDAHKSGTGNGHEHIHEFSARKILLELVKAPEFSRKI